MTAGHAVVAAVGADPTFDQVVERIHMGKFEVREEMDYRRGDSVAYVVNLPV